ncbi:hypothetical protein GTGU_03601 [Trabulsiella guamensis ATCC 49490]|uniref:Uncharacterized protein n=1 Tax=Trabulsiella guamensis ATCC 49490 TaxID=1005994 RepID=A0A084ZUD9_9ENTR|nr:hypothetical protein [Trabulsiella guamensis]KFC01084.1 hypothetical protein GTGU_03601 [Trabulsiella guamensis ATCC 49490]
MKQFYAELINQMLEDYSFKVENNPQGRDMYYGILASGVQHLYAVAFCASDNEALNDLRPFVNDVMNNVVPAPVVIAFKNTYHNY